MSISIIGAGFTGLTAAYRLLKAGHKVTIFESSRYVGGLAAGIKSTLKEEIPWSWDLEQYYHHWFSNDDHVFQLGKELGVESKFLTLNPRTSILFKDQIYPFDTPLNVLKTGFIKRGFLNPIETVQVATNAAKLKYLFNEKSSERLEKISAHDYLTKKLGENTYRKTWEPLLKGKFGERYKEVNARWFWARVYKRTPKLVYYQGGFSQFANDIAAKIQELGGEIRLGSSVSGIKPLKVNRFSIETRNSAMAEAENTTEPFESDYVILTTPPKALSNFVNNLPQSYAEKLKPHQGIGALTVILSLHHPMMPNTYWLNINNENWPFLAFVEHTNFVPKEKYNNEYIVYIGDYLSNDHPHMQMSKTKLIEKFTPYLKKINPLFSSESIIRSYIFRTPYAQPIVGINHQEKILPLETPIPNLYLASMAQVYPWDRGTNYAVELGEKVAAIITN